MDRRRIIARVLGPAVVSGFCCAGFGSLWFHITKAGGGDAGTFLFGYIGGCAGLIVGAIYGATECLVGELPDAITRQMQKASTEPVRGNEITRRREESESIIAALPATSRSSKHEQEL
jgi:hypothetical protein